ncbi:MAG: cytochrome c biogenesis protein CcsA [Chlamydiia bacterium]|nr:cytochrome c biogenesis protein CcsA [Chlamydiia bacterium]
MFRICFLMGVLATFFLHGGEIPVMKEGRLHPFSTLNEPFSEELLVIPDKRSANYLPLSQAFKSPEKNVSHWPDSVWKEVAHAKNLNEAKTILEANSPFNLRFETEKFYLKVPLQKIALIGYVLAIFGLWNGFFWGALAVHTLLLGLRVFILGRPPVSNMEETVLYVPWIGALLAGGISAYLKESFPLKVGALMAAILLAFPINSAMGNLQPVLNSRFWLMVHVLMIVASYGVLLFAGVSGHLYLLTGSDKARTLILPTLYLGVALLIPGTILGGVWAAESWGRFWDWDPKEAWAFISASNYLIFIHAYRYRKIGDFGLAIGSILGLMAISFTWYGVNYILGTGLHSYGFGEGGALYYWIFLGLEGLLISTFIILKGLKFNLPCDN